jgi:alpha-L-rhamnosidase
MTPSGCIIGLLLGLSNSGYNEDVAEMFNLGEEPSWGYMADHYTTFWEAFNANSQNLSLNHWTPSAVSEWLWRNVAGLNPDEQRPGYQAFTIHPRPTKEVHWYQASYDLIREHIVRVWNCDGNKFTLGITVTAHTAATVVILAYTHDMVTESGKPVARSEGVTFLRAESSVKVYQVSSGIYRFNSLISGKINQYKIILNETSNANSK